MHARAAAALVLAAALPAAPALAQPWGEYGYGGHWGPGSMWGVMGAGMGILMILFWVVIIVGAIAFIRWLFTAGGPGGGAPRPAETAEDILKKRYARGEIEKEEFEAKMRDLRAH